MNIKQWWARLTRATIEPDTLLARFKKAKWHCPDCGGALLMGPEGGLCVNVKCETCAHEFNVAVWGNDVLSIDRIRWSGPDAVSVDA